jgi:hypothetical protein
MKECFVDKAKILQRGDFFRHVLKEFLGVSLIFADTGELQQKERKALSSAFFKVKMQKMIEVVKKTVIKEISNWNEKFVDGGSEIELVKAF